MKKVLWLLMTLVLLLLCVPTSHAQTRVLIGPTGGSLYGNDYGGVVGRIEIPFAKRLELDGDAEISPRATLGGFTINLEKKINLGAGYAYSFAPTVRVWFTKSWALDGSIDRSTYSVTATSKTEYFTKTGFTYRTIWFDAPTRFGFDYVREVANGLMSNGDESNHLQGGSVTIDTRLGCKGPMCFRLFTNIQGGRVLNQGNPVCDGNAPNPQHLPPCPRTAAMGGGASMSLYLEFPRRKGTENSVF